jgi:hypothetical protein
LRVRVDKEAGRGTLIEKTGGLFLKSKIEMVRHLRRNAGSYQGNLAYYKEKQSPRGTGLETGHLDCIREIHSIIQGCPKLEDIVRKVEDIRSASVEADPKNESPQSFYASGVKEIAVDFLRWLEK